MFKNLSELKEFIVWAQSQNIKTMTVGDISFETSDIHYANKIMTEEVTTAVPQNLDANPQAEAEEDESLLYWSAGD